MTHNIRWNDLQIVLAEAEHGSASRAAALLGINHSTVIRRINGFEATHNVTLFERHPTGLKPTAAGHSLLTASRPIESAVHNIQREIFGRDSKLEGPIRVTTTDSIADQILAPQLKEFHLAHPAITLGLIVTNTRLDLPRLDAALSVRPSNNPLADLIGRNVSSKTFTVYAQKAAYTKWKELPEEQRPWIGISHDLRKSLVSQWMRNIEDGGQIITIGNSFVVNRELTANGFGFAVLPCFLGDPDKRPIRVEPPIPELETSVWVLIHKDLRTSARVKALSDHLTRGLKRQRDLFAGQTYVPPTV
jgi:DNA-binding transcriptional LysR family regulator